MIKKYLIIILVSFILPLYSLASESVFDKYETNTSDKILNQSTYKINAIDPTLTNNWSAGMYPGLRGANQLIIYTSNYGISTGTNEYGGEAIVKGNRVVELSGADSLIPTDGVVISAHGNAKTWLNKRHNWLSEAILDLENSTGIKEVNVSGKFNEKDVYYNMLGQKVNKPNTGIYIRNGEKVLVK